MQNKQRGVMGILVLIVISIGLLYYFKVDVHGVITYVKNIYIEYFNSAKQSISNTDFKSIFPTTTSSQ
jgi:hypothetical protein